MITIDHFSDVLCVWAYGGQIRLDELRATFGTELLVRERFIPLFADTSTKIGEGWRERGGYDAFGEHAADVCARWEHTQLNAAVWRDCRPLTCSNAHLFLKAVALAISVDDRKAEDTGREQYHQLVARVRRAFFEQGQDIGRMSVLESLLEPSDPGVDTLRAHIESGSAAAALHRDAELANSFGVRGSPTYIFNEGRQMLYGNVGYRIIETNVKELLTSDLPAGEPSWC